MAAKSEECWEGIGWKRLFYVFMMCSAVLWYKSSVQKGLDSPTIPSLTRFCWMPLHRDALGATCGAKESFQNTLSQIDHRSPKACWVSLLGLVWLKHVWKYCVSCCMTFKSTFRHQDSGVARLKIWHRQVQYFTLVYPWKLADFEGLSCKSTGASRRRMSTNHLHQQRTPQTLNRISWCIGKSTTLELFCTGQTFDCA